MKTTTRRAATKKTSRSLLDCPALRFNWGFGDAAADIAAGRPVRDVSTHFDRDYAAGYLARVNGGCPIPANSSAFGGWS